MVIRVAPTATIPGLRPRGPSGSWRHPVPSELNGRPAVEQDRRIRCAGARRVALARRERKLRQVCPHACRQVERTGVELVVHSDEAGAGPECGRRPLGQEPWAGQHLPAVRGRVVGLSCGGRRLRVLDDAGHGAPTSSCAPPWAVSDGRSAWRPARGRRCAPLTCGRCSQASAPPSCWTSVTARSSCSASSGGMRRSELVGLDVVDVAQIDEGLLVGLRSSKTDQEGRGARSRSSMAPIPPPARCGLGARG